MSLAAGVLQGAAREAEVWSFDRLDRFGAHSTHVEGAPSVRNGAIVFSGARDAIFLDVHPLAGAQQFTWEVIFRPASGGAPEQRFFHLQEEGSDNRMLFETRLREGKWCLDTYVKSNAGAAVLLDTSKLHSLDEWHHAAAVFDGRELRNYVDGRQQGAAALKFEPHREGRSSVGVRINRVDYFKGEIRQARMTKSVLGLSDFLKVSA